jgi:lipopolysaccharide export LptBFGC system permease protein LptF
LILPFSLIKPLVYQIFQWIGILLFAVLALVQISQLIQMKFFLWPINQQVIREILPILYHLSFVLLEIVLPLTALMAISIVFQFLKSSGWIDSFKGFGFHRYQLLVIPLIFSIAYSGLVLYCALWLTPLHLQHIRPSLMHILEDRFEREDFRFDQKGTQFDSGLLYTGVDDQRYLFLMQNQTLQNRDAQDTYTYLKAQVKKIRLDTVQNELKLELQAVEAQTDQKQKLKMKIQQLDFSIKQDFKFKIFSLPNAGFQDELDLSNPHHHFIFHKRYAQALLCFLLLMLASLTGIHPFFTPFKQSILICVVILGTYGLMRSLELLCRQDLFSPIHAAWFPMILPILSIVMIHFKRDSF